MLKARKYDNGPTLTIVKSKSVAYQSTKDVNTERTFKTKSSTMTFSHTNGHRGITYTNTYTSKYNVNYRFYKVQTRTDCFLSHDTYRDVQFNSIKH